MRPEDPPPVGPQLHPAGDVGAAIGDRDEEQQQHAGDLQPPEAALSPAVPGTAHTSSTASVISTFHAGTDSHPATPCSAFTISTPTTTSAAERATTWRSTCSRDLAAAQPRGEREGYRHADDEEESGKHQVGDRHAVVGRALVAQERRSARDPGHLVHEQHQQHVHAAQQVDRPDPGHSSPRQWPKGNTIPAPATGGQMERRAFLELLAATPLAATARADTAFDPPAAARLQGRHALRARRGARDAGTVPGPRDPHPLAARGRRDGRGRRGGRARDDGARHARPHGRGDDARRLAALLRAERRRRDQGQRRRAARTACRRP